MKKSWPTPFGGCKQEVEDEAMPSDRAWRGLERLANLIGIVAALAALGLVGYFASLGILLVRHSSG